ncbi:MAG: M23 family metallopeptidase [Myxococcales bacterium]|nr:M23 family metallopeptidase [Myxococcales bacterium]
MTDRLSPCPSRMRLASTPSAWAVVALAAASLVLSSCSAARTHYLWQPAPVLEVDVPLIAGTLATISQGFQGYFSHKDDQRFAVDISLPEGTPIVAARGGRVLAVKSDSNTGCNNARCADQANYVLIDHGDGTVGHYYHLRSGGVTVKPGDNVCTGQLIGYSGNTGFSSGPHLHFSVMDVYEESLPVRFRDLGREDTGGVVFPGMELRSSTHRIYHCDTPHHFSRCGRRVFLHTGVILDHEIPCTTVRRDIDYPISGRTLTKSGWVQIATRSKPKGRWTYDCLRTDAKGRFATLLRFPSVTHEGYAYLMISAAKSKCSAYAGWSSSLKLRFIDRH